MAKNVETKISESTVVPLGFIFTVVSIFVGGIMWLADISTKATFARDSVVEMKADRKEDDKTLQSIDKRLSSIEGFLRGMEKKK